VDAQGAQWDCKCIPVNAQEEIQMFFLLYSRYTHSQTNTDISCVALVG